MAVHIEYQSSRNRHKGRIAYTTCEQRAPSSIGAETLYLKGVANMNNMRRKPTQRRPMGQLNVFQVILGAGAFCVFVLIFFVVLHVLGDVNYGAFQGIGQGLAEFLVAVFVVVVAAGAAWIVSFFVTMAISYFRRPPQSSGDAIPLGTSDYTEEPQSRYLPPGPIVDSDPSDAQG